MPITDKFMYASAGTRAEPTTLAAQKSSGAAVLSADDLSTWAVATPTSFVLFKVDTQGVEIPGTRTDWVGIVSGNTITQLTLTAGTDDTYPAGSALIAAATAEWGDRVVDGLLVSHDQDGTLRNNIVTTSKINDGSITAPKLSTSAITLGYAQITTSLMTTSTSYTQATGLSSVATIPAGGRKVKITAFCEALQASTTANVSFSIWDGTVGSGTQLAEGVATIAAGNYVIPANIMAIVTPSPGSKTYNVGWKTSAGTGTLTANTYSPAFLLVEAI